MFYRIKETVSVILSDPTSKDTNARFTTVPLKTLSNQLNIVRYFSFPCFKMLNVNSIFSLQWKCLSHFCRELTLENIQFSTF